MILLGVHDRCTPGLASEVSLTTVAMSSFEEAEKALSERGICLDVSTIKNITIRFAARANHFCHIGYNNQKDMLDVTGA